MYIEIFLTNQSYRTFVGKSSMPKQSKELKPIVETNPKAQDNARLAASDFTK